MRYSKIREMDVSNGEGLGVSLFVQGCHFHCKGCFNSETWDFDGGKEWNEETKDKFFGLIDRDYIKRVTILGGEPLCNENVEEVCMIAREIKNRFPQKKIWIYTGYSFADLLSPTLINGSISQHSLYRILTLTYIDILVDGRFDIDKQDLYNETIVWAGSTNQRVLDVKKSLQTMCAVLYDSQYDKTKLF